MDLMGQMRYGETIIRFRWLIIAVSLAAIFGAGYGMKFLGFESDDRIFFSSGNPQLKALDEFENTYNKESNVIFVIEARSGDIFTASSLSAIKELTETSWQIPYSSRVNSITNYQHTWVDGDDLLVGDLVSNPDSLTEKGLDDIRAVALKEPMLVNKLISPDGTMTAVLVTVLKPGGNDVTPEIDAYADDLAERFKAGHPGLNLYLTGAIPFDMAFTDVSQDDMQTLVPAMFIILVIGIYLFLRSVSGTFTTVIVIVFASIAAMGMAGWYGIKLSPPTTMAPVIVLTLAVADSIHILTTMFHELRRGMTKHEAIVESMRVNLLPVFLTSITTAIGFLSMNSSDAPPFRELGNMAATGVLAALFFSIFLLPALISVLPVRVRVKTVKKSAFPERLGEYVVKRRAALFLGMSALVLITSLGVARLDLDDNFIEYFDDRYPIRAESDYVADKYLGMDIIEISLPAGAPSGVNDPGYLSKVEQLANHLRAQEKVTHVSAVTDIVKKLNRTMNSDDPAYYRIPDDRELVAQYMLLYEMSLPYGLDLNSTINVDKSASRLSATLGRMTAAEMREMEQEMISWMQRNTPEIFSLPTGISLMFAHISERNINGMLRGGIVALVLISAILILALRSFKIGIISLVPNLFPAIMAFGLWGHIYGRVGLAVSVVSVISLGIVVDDTVHFLSKYLRARREFNMNTDDAVRYTFKTVGRAIITTSVVLTGGFLVLALSGFRVNFSMGLLTAFAISFALLADLFFLPPLLMWVERKSRCADAGESLICAADKNI